MATEFILVPNGRWQGRDQTGQPVQNGKLYTYLTKTTTPKATYQDYQGLQPNTNPVILDGKGEANIYWATDALYTYKLFTEDDQEVTTQDDYPIVGTNTTEIVSESESNVARNNQFSYWYQGASFSPVVGVGSIAPFDFVADDWYYSRVGTGYTVNITREAFAPDQDSVPGNPTYFFRYSSGVPVGETKTRLFQTYSGVQTLAGRTVTVATRAKSSTNSTVSIYLVQDFGGGGSSSAETLVGQFDLTSSWQQITGSVTLPNLVGKTVGTNSQLILEYRFPNDSSAVVDLCNVQFQVGAALSTFPFQSKETQYQELVTRIQDAAWSTGDGKLTLKTTADVGWAMCNDSTIGNTNSGASVLGIQTKALFTLLWTNLTDTWSPMLTSAGAPSGRGASAEADWNALKRLTLTRNLGRAIAAAGSGSGLTTRALGEFLGAETVTLDTTMIPAHTHPPLTGTSFRVNVGGGGGLDGVGGTLNASDVTTGATGGGAAHANMQPTSFWNVMIKL